MKTLTDVLRRRPWLLVAAALVPLVVAAAGHRIWSERRLAGRERAADERYAEGRTADERAAELEKRAAAYTEKIDRLEQTIAEIGEIARRQDEELEKIGGRVADARGRVERARSLRSIESTAAELCAKLADLGHGCD